jgi:hypothetical protein
MSRQDRDEHSELDAVQGAAQIEQEELQAHQELSADGHGRRRLGKAALASVPVLLTMHSRPLRATGTGNCDISGWHSGGSQQPEAQSCGTNPLSPDGWRDQIPNKDKDKLMQTLFEQTEGSEHDGTTVEEIIQDSDATTGQEGLLRVGTAAWLNAHNNRYENGVGLSEERIKGIVNDTFEYGEYATSKATPVELSEVIQFFEQTWGGPSYLY